MKKVMTFTAAAVLSAGIFGADGAAAAENDVQGFKELLTEVGRDKGIPPEILKAMAYAESKGFVHFDENGKAIRTDDGGIGLMQLTLTPEEISRYQIDTDRLESDVKYHIEQAADHLLRKKNLNLPLVNDNELHDLESWYFAVMAYNGLSEINDPGTHPVSSYQERVFDYVRNYSLIPLGETPELTINYGDTDEDRLIMRFPADLDYTWPTETESLQLAEIGDMVFSYNEDLSYSNLRESITDATPERINHYTPMQITGGPYEATGEANQYVFYEVKGNFGTGYIASSNLQSSDDLKVFSDLNTGEVETAVAYLQHRGIINGYTDGTYRERSVLERRHAAALIVRALGLTKPDNYVVKSPDLTPSTPGYEDLAIMEYHNIMGRGGTMDATKPLKRSQMASILNRAFGDVYEDPTGVIRIRDIAVTDANYPDISTLVYNDITVADADRAFNPWRDVTRGQYALFVERTIRLMEEK
ncbi:S-layer homology domain-containing protein [Jeotgalibacillus aurantiacus]|uniref:S-layer homology domain-containing protein n=1 Tax=Jeotgalibacillus aurantiacus TaxID=2763266 RepID=UPI001D0A23E1|nr:S-layer homology domain-containing protein [Jeotgalibacillus aurantiacus]